MSDLSPDEYQVGASTVDAGGTTYTPSVDRPTLLLFAGDVTGVVVTYSPYPGRTRHEQFPASICSQLMTWQCLSCR